MGVSMNRYLTHFIRQERWTKYTFNSGRTGLGKILQTMDLMSSLIQRLKTAMITGFFGNLWAPIKSELTVVFVGLIYTIQFLL